MEAVEGARTFATSGEAYDAFMGRYSSPLAELFADFAGVAAFGRVLDVGCGPGSLTGVLAQRVGADSVSACDPSGPFAQECAARHPDVEVRQGQAEALPFEDDTFDGVLAQLVLHFVSDPALAARESRRVLRPGGTMAACMWESPDGMQMLRHFWDAAQALDPAVGDNTRTVRFGRPGEIAELLEDAGFVDIRESTLTVETAYSDFAELWAGFLAGIGPAGVHCQSLDTEAQAALRHEMHDRLGSPHGSFSLGAVAISAAGRVPR